VLKAMRMFAHWTNEVHARSVTKSERRKQGRSGESAPRPARNFLVAVKVRGSIGQ
jgi:hypothetical protein